jgi:streptomycin 6-kinase
VIVVPETVQAKAAVAGAQDWLDELPALVAELESRWRITVGRVYPDATEAFVAEAITDGGDPAVLKLVVPRGGGNGHGYAADEIAVLRLVDGDGCVRLLRHDAAHGAMLLEKLGPSMYELQLPIRERHETLCDLATRIWRPAPDSALPTGAQKGRRLSEMIVSTWQSLGHPCPQATVEHALDCASRRTGSHDDRRAMLAHGDIHQWNALSTPLGGFSLVDPDGLLAEPEYDLAILMREDPVELLEEGPQVRAHWLAERTGTDATAIWEWGVVERVSTGLMSLSIGMTELGQQMLAAADHIARYCPDLA